MMKNLAYRSSHLLPDRSHRIKVKSVPSTKWEKFKIRKASIRLNSMRQASSQADLVEVMVILLPAQISSSHQLFSMRRHSFRIHMRTRSSRTTLARVRTSSSLHFICSKSSAMKHNEEAVVDLEEVCLPSFYLRITSMTRMQQMTTA